MLSTRWRFLEHLFGGLDKVYQDHQRIGRWLFFLILFHSLFLAVDRLPDAPAFHQAMWFYRPKGDLYLWGHNVDVIALLGFAVLIALTLGVKIPYPRWEKTHEFFGLAGLKLCYPGLLMSHQRDPAAYDFAAGPAGGPPGLRAGVGGASLFGYLLGGTELSFRLTRELLAFAGTAIGLIIVLSALFSIRKVMTLEPAIVFKG